MTDRDRLPFELPPLPDTFEVRREGDDVLVLRRDLVPALGALGYGPRRDGTRTTSVLSGRRPLAEFALPEGVLLVRRFHHGGLLGGLTGERFADPRRPFVELVLSARLRAAGVSTPEVVAARARRLVPVGWQLEVVSRRVPDTLDLARVRTLHGRGEVPSGAWRALLTALGQLLARLHALGFLHADLQPANLLVPEGCLTGADAPRLWVLDLDRSRFLDPLPVEARRDNLRRLLRHVLQRARAGGPAVRTRDLVRVLRAYEPRRAERHQDWRAIARAQQGRAAWHGLGRVLERGLGQVRPADSRDR